MFSNVIPKGSSLIFEGVYIQGYKDSFWAKFDFDINNLSFQLDSQHYGTGSMDEDLNGEEFPGLSFDGIVPYVWTCTTGCAVSGGVAIFLQATYNGENYYIELSFDPQSCGFHILHLWSEKGVYAYKEFAITEKRKVKILGGYQEIELNHKIVATYSDKRALKDKKERDKLINKVTKRLQENKIKGKEKYIEKYCDGGKVRYRLNFKKIEEDKKYDGYYALAYSDVNMPALKIIKIHKQIYNVETAFRELKTDLNIRPIYHYTPKRIKGHIIVSFLAYFLLKHIERRLKYNKKTQDMVITSSGIINALKGINATETDINGKKYYLKTKHNKLASKMFEIFEIKNMKHIMSEEEMKEYLFPSL